MPKISVVGAGNVGASAALYLAEAEMGDVTLIDIVEGVAKGKALDLLEEKQLPGGGWAAERRLYAVSSSVKTRAEYVDWDGARPREMNEWVTADALHVLRAAGRM